MLSTSIYLLNLVHRDSSFCRDKVNRAAGRRSGASFFARHRDYFIVTRNLTAIYLDLVPSNSFIVTLGISSTYRNWQKTRQPQPFAALRAGSDGI